MTVEHHWRVERIGRKWTIQPLTDWASVLMQDVRTPSSFERKRDAQEWLDLSLSTHLCDCVPEEPNG